MPKQPLNIDQTAWSNEPEQEVKTGRAKAIFMMVFSGLISALMFLIATPFFIVIWTINFIKSLFGMVVMWVVGKLCILLFTLLVVGFLNYIHVIGQTMADNITGTLSNFFFINSITGQMEPFPYFDVEIWIIVIIALILATVSTIYRDEVKAV